MKALEKVKNINSVDADAPSHVLKFYDEFAPGCRPDRIDQTLRVLREDTLKDEEDLILSTLKLRIAERPCKLTFLTGRKFVLYTHFCLPKYS
jgi:hypothetical protein